jgi:DNA polymerase III delta prime subunit
MAGDDVRLVQKYAPRRLADVFGQETLIQYLKSVVAHPENAYRNHLVAGAYGSGKTASVRAFARDLLNRDDIERCSQYVEIDSGDKNIMSDFNRFRDYIFQRVDGYKCVAIDECHLIPDDVMQKFLKPLEDNVLPIFFFFVTTDYDKVPDTIKSRCLSFQVNSFSSVQVMEYLNKILQAEGRDLQENTKHAIVFSAQGHLRNLLNQLQICIFQGEEYYMKMYSRLNNAIEGYFRGKDVSVIETMIRTPFEILQQSMEYYILTNIVREHKVFKANEVPKIMVFYLKMKRYLKTETDFYSFLYIFFEFLGQFKV